MISIGTSSILTNRTLQYLSYLTSRTTSTYDMYNAYPDRPLPVFSTVENNALKSLQLYTTPDFFIYRNTDYIDNVIDVIEDRISSGEDTLLNEENQTSAKDKIEGSHKAYANSLKQITRNANESIFKDEKKIQDDIDTILNTYLRPLPPDKQTSDNLYAFLMYKQWDYSKLTPEQKTQVDNVENSNFLDSLKILQNIKYPTSLGTIRQQIGIAQKNILNDLSKNVLGVSDAIKTYNISLLTLINEIINIEDRNDTLEKMTTSSENVSDSGSISTNDIHLIKSVLNPSAGAFNLQSMNMMKHKFQRLKAKLNRNVPITTIGMAFPTFKLYIIEEDAKEWLYFNDFYDYGAVKSIKVHDSRKDATTTAHIVLSNIYGRLTNIIAGMRTNAENPFYVHPSEEEEVNNIMLREGARIQIRLGYTANLDVDSIVFSGRIQQIQGTEEIVIVAQSDGIELTREIGIGAGEDFGGILNSLQVKGKQMGYAQTSNALGLVTAILDAAKTPLKGLGTFAPFLGESRIRNISVGNSIPNVSTDNAQYGLIGDLTQGIKSQLTKSITKNILSIDPKLIDTRLTNVNLNSSDLSNNFFHTLVGRSRWLIHNETIWDSLQDYCLQLGDRICMVRPFDEYGTLVIDSEDGIYQRSMENSSNALLYYNRLRELDKAERTAISSIEYLKEVLTEEEKNQGKILHEFTKQILNNTVTLAFKDISNNTIKTQLDQIIIHIAEMLSGLPQTSGRTDQTYFTQKISEYYDHKESVAAFYDTSTYQALQEVREALHNNTYSTDKFESEKLAKKPLDQFVLAYSAQAIVRTLKTELASSLKSFRPVRDIHLKTSSNDIIQNHIRTVAGFNRVEVSYLDEDILGTLISTIGMKDIGNTFGLGRAISLDVIDKPSAQASTSAVASPVLEPEKIMTYGTSQKNAGIRGTIFIDNPKIVANNILANLIRDYYDGELVILMDPTIMSNDIIFIQDDVNDMWGIIAVKEVTHSFAPDTGAVSVIKPDMYVKTSINTSLSQWKDENWIGRGIMAASSLILTVVTIGLGAGIGKFGMKFLGGIGSKFFGTTAGKTAQGAVMGQANKQVMKAVLGGADDVVGEATKTLSKTFKKTANISGPDQSKILQEMVNSLGENQTAITALKKATEVTVNGQVKQLHSFNGDIGELTIKVMKSVKGNTTGDAAERIVAESLESFNKALINSTTLSKNAAWQDIMSNASANLFFGIRNNFLNLLRGPLSMGALKGIIALGISSKIGSHFMPSFDMFSTQLGEFLNQAPISVSGLIHKGEPMVANLDGMKRAHFSSMRDWIRYKIGETFNPLREMYGDLNETLYNTQNNVKH